MNELIVTKNTEKYDKKTGAPLWKVRAETWSHGKTMVIVATNRGGINQITLDGKTARLIFNTLKRHYKTMEKK